MRNQVNLTVFNLRKREIWKKKYKIINGFFMTVVEIKTSNLVFFYAETINYERKQSIFLSEMWLLFNSTRFCEEIKK